MELDILEFRIPVENNKTLLVWDIEPNLSPLQIYVSLAALGLCEYTCCRC